MSSAPNPNSRTPLLAAHASSQQPSSRYSRDPSRNPQSRIQRSTSQFSPNRDRRRVKRRKSPPIQFVPAVLALGLLAFVLFMAWDISDYGNCYFKSLCKVLGSGEDLDEIFYQNAGAYAPWRSRGPGGGKKGLPRGCEINQITLLHRHAARYPTTSASECMKEALGKIARREIGYPRKHAELAFLAKADFGLTGWKFDHLLNQGRKAAWRSGREMSALYQSLIQTGESLFSRSAGGDRVVETAGYWLEGFHDQPFKLKPVEQLPVVNVTISEGDTSNNTLSVHSCPAYNKQPIPELPQLLHLLKPARNRLNRLLRPRPALTVDDLVCLADMCPFDAQAEGDDWEAWSRWCGLFTRDEWEVIGHLKDARRYYDVGEESLYGKTMGAGWANELLARITDSAPKDSTSSNTTLNADVSSFPRGGRRFFVDFGHDNEMVEVLAAMGILKQQRPLSADSIPDKRTFITSEIIPFGSRFVFERIGCDLGDWEPDPETPGTGGDGRRNYIRVFINDVLVPIEHIACQQSGYVEHKMCEVELFLETQFWSQYEVNWELCYENRTET